MKTRRSNVNAQESARKVLAASGLIGASDIPFWPVWIAAVIGAFLGDWVSYWFGYHYKHQVTAMWPLSRRSLLRH